jgi:hypothetical protein
LRLTDFGNRCAYESDLGHMEVRYYESPDGSAYQREMTSQDQGVQYGLRDAGIPAQGVGDKAIAYAWNTALGTGVNLLAQKGNWVGLIEFADPNGTRPYDGSSFAPVMAVLFNSLESN